MRTALGTSIGALVIVLGVPCASTALASPPSVTLSGRDGDGYTPDSNHNNAEVSATLSKGVASGSLSTESREEFGPPNAEFAGKVTCMAIDGNRVVVGAFGKAYGKGGELPGSYAQVLILIYRKIYDSIERQRYPESFGMLGKYNEGFKSPGPPSCSAVYSFSHQHWPSFNPRFYEDKFIFMSPSIVSPVDGYVSHTGRLRLRGSGEPTGQINVYEVGHEASATTVNVTHSGEWKLTIHGLSVGTHVFTAKAVNGSTTPANTVEVKVG